MNPESLPLEEIARLFHRPQAETNQVYQEWSEQRQSRNRPLTPDIKLLAALSGLSVASISNFLRNKPGRLSEENANRLARLVELVGYVPSSAAQSLRGQQRNAVGIATPLSSISPGFYLEILSGIEQEASILGFRRFIFDIAAAQARDDFFDKMPFLDIVDGLIAVGLYIDPTRLQILSRRNLPVVNIHNRLPHPPVVANVLPPDEQVLQHLIDHHLIKYHGYRRLALVTLKTTNLLKMGDVEREDWTRIARIEAYKTALRLNDIPLDKNLIFEVAEHSFEEGYEVLDRLCRFNDALPPDKKIQAVVCTSDTLAAAILTVARRKGINLPVTGFDNLPLAELLGITTVDQRAKNTGRLAFRHLYNALVYQKREGKLPPLVEEGIDMQMVLRYSCGCPEE